MKLESISISGFRCFGPEKEVVELNKLTCFVGHNGSGKSAVLHALVKLFGLTQSDRAIKSSDFHVPDGQKLEDETERSLCIEVELVFPELQSNEALQLMAVPEAFKQMTIDEPGAAPYCRVRLDAKWSQGNTSEGDIETDLNWITTASSEIEDTDRVKVSASQRSRIHVHYIPAIRDPLTQIKYTAGTIMHRLIRAIEWSDPTKELYQTLTEQFKTAFQGETGVGLIQQNLSEQWERFCGNDIYKNVTISPLSSDFKKAVSMLDVFFSPSPEGSEHDVTRLSEGLRSLFYLSMIHSVFCIESQVVSHLTHTQGISDEHLNIPHLTVFAVEEPENHLAPHYLGRITKIFRDISERPEAQTVLTSHSASVLKRIYPEEIRHLRLDTNLHAISKNIVLPDKGDEAYKYVRNAVQAYPELYFAKHVVLCEGDSEEIVLPRLFDANGLSTDENFISIVPLGGRHVNHFWRLLTQLGIPHVTLLDYDRRRETGGWARIKYVCKQLLKNGVSREDLLLLEDGSILDDDKLEEMHTWEPNPKTEKEWIEDFKEYNVYFSYPIDFDLMVLKAFPNTYMKPQEGASGPNIPSDYSEDNYKALRSAYASVIKKDVGDITRDMSRIIRPELYFWYRYLFLGRSKPVSHMRMVTEVSVQELQDNCPQVLKDVVSKIQDRNE